MKRRRIALVGAGSIGANHARVLIDSGRADLGIVVDIDEERARRLANRYGTVASTSMADAAAFDAIIIATSTESHAELSLPLIRSGLPVFVEKPLAAHLGEVLTLCEAAAEVGSILMCGFVERFNAVVNQALGMLDDPPIHIVTMRHSPASPRIVGSVVHDLLIHDIDLVLRFMDGNHVTDVRAECWGPKGSDTPEIADALLRFDHGGMATLSASRSGQRKIRSVQVYTEHTMLDLDLLRADITVYRDVSQNQPGEASPLMFRSETIIDIPFVRHRAEPLALQLEHFLDLIEGRADAKCELEGLIRPHVVAQEVDDISRDVLLQRRSETPRIH